MKNIIEDLFDQHYSIIDIDPKHYRLVENFQEAWKEYTQLPFEIKNTLAYKNGVGFEHKVDGQSYDDKENFHLRKDFVKSVIHQSEHEVIHNFLTKGELLHDYLHQFLELIYKELCNVLLYEYDFMQHDLRLILRSLHYFSHQEISTDVAKQHLDKGMFTAATYNSAPGLQILDVNKRVWKDINLEENQIFLMTGMQGQYFSRNFVKALCHRVINCEKTELEGRFSQVSFFDSYNFSRYNKKKFGSMQNHEEGFNYDLSLDQVKKYFVK